MTYAPGAQGGASAFLGLLLEGATLSQQAIRAVEQVRLAEVRDAIFGERPFAGDAGWRMLLILYAASAGSYKLAPDVFDLMCFASPEITSRWVRYLSNEGFVREEDGSLSLTAEAMSKVEAVLGSA